MSYNSNRQMFLRNLLGNSPKKMLFVLRDHSRVNVRPQGDNSLAVFRIDDIVAIKDGNKTLYRGSDFARRPRYTVEFRYAQRSNYIFTNSSGSQYVNVDPLYNVVIVDQETNKRIIVDVYRSVKEMMEGKVLNLNRRALFEREFIRLIDHTNRLDIPQIIEKAVSKAHI